MDENLNGLEALLANNLKPEVVVGLPAVSTVEQALPTDWQETAQAAAVAQAKDYPSFVWPGKEPNKGTLILALDAATIAEHFSNNQFSRNQTAHHVDVGLQIATIAEIALQHREIFAKVPSRRKTSPTWGGEPGLAFNLRNAHDATLTLGDNFGSHPLLGNLDRIKHFKEWARFQNILVITHDLDKLTAPHAGKPFGDFPTSGKLEPNFLEGILDKQANASDGTLKVLHVHTPKPAA